jgi:hypothetical protein
LVYRKSPSSQYAQKRVQSVVAAKLKKAQIQAKPLIRAHQQPLLGPKIKVIRPQDFVRGKPSAPGMSTMARDKLLVDAQGWYANFASKSSPGTTYRTVIWTTRQGQFKPNDVSCNCNGWKFNKKCHHCDDIVRMYRQAHPNDPTIFTSMGRQL